MKTFQAERPFAEKIPIECFQMSDIEDDAMTLRNGTLVQRVGLHHLEDFIASPASIRQTSHESGAGPNFEIGLKGSHSLPDWSRYKGQRISFDVCLRRWPRCFG